MRAGCRAGFEGRGKPQHDLVQHEAAVPGGAQAALPAPLQQAEPDQLVDGSRCGHQAADRGQAVEVETLAEPEPHQQRLVGLLGVAQRRDLHGAVTRLLHPLEPALGLPLRDDGMPPAVENQPAVRAGAHAHVFPVAPVQQVVPAFLARRRVVGDLVGRQPRPLGHLLGDLVQRQRRVGVGHHEPAGCMQLGERRLRLDGELVERQMPAGQVERLAKLAAPVLGRLARPGVDQVEAEPLECFTCNIYPRPRLGRACAAGPAP